MYVNFVKGNPKKVSTLEIASKCTPHLMELDKILNSYGQYGIFYTHRNDENENGDNILVFPVRVEGNQVLAALLDFVMDMKDRGAIETKGNEVLWGLSKTLMLMYEGASTEEIDKLLGKIENAAFLVDKDFHDKLATILVLG